MGFAVVDVNMRGTGCSGGAFNYFEPLQSLDAYDVIQTIAHQSWVLHHKVGMFGISYGGISQLFAAQERPPALSAIAPLSVVDATATTLYPGGVLNTGFALPWAEERQQNAEPASPGHGERWATNRSKGDTTCAGNQDMHEEATNLLAEIKENATYNPPVADPLDPITFVHNIDVPTFMACQWEDEQTGGHCADLAEHFTGTEQKWFTFTNGAHIDSLDPATFDRLYDFLELYVAHQAPTTKRGSSTGSRRRSMRRRFGLSRKATKSRCRPTRSRNSRSTRRRWRRSKRCRRSGCCSTTVREPRRRQRPRRATRIRRSKSRSRRSRSRARRPARGTSGRKARSTEAPAAAEGVDSYTSDASATPLTDYIEQRGPGRAVGRRLAVGMELGAAASGRRGRPTSRRRSAATRP